jgi:hypothetical protein
MLTRLNKLFSYTQKLHRYSGLLISPFLLVFSLSVLSFNHGSWLKPVKTLPQIKTSLDEIPSDSTDLLIAKAILKKLCKSGEIDYISKNKEQLVFPVRKPGSTTIVSINTNTRDVILTQKDEGVLRGLGYLHTMPGQHNAKIRGNSLLIRIWRSVADIVVYLLLFLTASGIFLWYRSGFERKSGLLILVLGMLSFMGLLFLIL